MIPHTSSCPPKMSLRLPGSFIAATNVTCIWQPGELFTRAGSGRDITGLGGASAARLSQSWVAVSFVPPANQPSKVLWGPSPERSCGARRSLPWVLSRGVRGIPEVRGEMGITSGLYSPRAAPRGPEVTGEPSAVSSRLRAQLPGPGPSAPAPSAPGPPARGHLCGHPFPPSILFPGTGGTGEKAGLLLVPKPKWPCGQTASEQAGDALVPSEGPALPLPALGGSREAPRAAKSLSPTDPDMARRPEMPPSGSVPPPCPPEAICGRHLSEYLGAFKTLN